MKRVLAIAAVLLAGVALVVFATGSSDDDGGYRVRAIFDNAAFVIPGMDVRIGGVVVGSIASIDLTDDKKAAVVLQIDNPNYHDFRKDGFCTIRPQSLIGERFIECEPTQPKPASAARPALLSAGAVRAGQGPVPAAGDEHGALGRPRPDPEHHAAALPRSGSRSSSTSSAPRSLGTAPSSSAR